MSMSREPPPMWYKWLYIIEFSLLVLVSIYTGIDLIHKGGTGFSNLGIYVFCLAIIVFLSVLTFVLAGWSILRHATSVSSIRIQASEAHNQSMERALRKLRRILISVGIAGAVTVLYQIYFIVKLKGERAMSFEEKRLEAREAYSIKHTVRIGARLLLRLSLSLSLSLSLPLSLSLLSFSLSIYIYVF